MKILITHRYYWPDTPPFAAILRQMALGFSEMGHEVSVFSSKPSYRERATIDGIEDGRVAVRRIGTFPEKQSGALLRGLNALLYSLAAFVFVFRSRADVVLASTFPPVLAGVAVSLAAKLSGAHFVYHMMDVHPEVSENSGGIMGKSPVAALFRWLDNGTLRRAAKIVVLSEDMADTLRARGIGPLDIEVINNFELGEGTLQAPVPPTEPSAKPPHFIFAGNMGRFQQVPLLVEGLAAAFEARPEARLTLLGDGVVVPELKARYANHPQIEFLPFCPFEEAQKIIVAARVGLVSLAPGIFRTSNPSKVLTYTGQGLAILALVEPQSSLSRDINSSGIGRATRAMSVEAVAEAALALIDSPPSAATIAAWHAENGSRSAALAKWRHLLGALG